MRSYLESEFHGVRFSLTRADFCAPPSFDLDTSILHLQQHCDEDEFKNPAFIATSLKHSIRAHRSVASKIVNAKLCFIPPDNLPHHANNLRDVLGIGMYQLGVSTLDSICLN